MAPSPGKFLSEIIAARLRSVEEARARMPLGQVQQEAEKRTERRNFVGPLSARGVNIIAEMKKASPSKGVLREDYQAEAIARSYEQVGAAALSVLTEESYFQGSLDHLRRARAATKLPVLRKDFILDGYQVYEAIASGADSILLIVAALDPKTLENLIRLCRNLRIEPLVEVHSEDEVETALEAGAKLIGVNNRHLKTFEVSLATSLRLIDRIPRDCVAVSESGISTGLEVARMKEAGFSAVLVGEQFMRAPDPGRELEAMLAGALEESLRPESKAAQKK